MAGANSFTEAQARSRIEAAGYSQLANLRKDDAGIWHAQARHAGASVTVSMPLEPLRKCSLKVCVAGSNSISRIAT